ncbi:MAG: LamG domain-containing protein, partial [Patescibacteria group bacterium]
VWNIIRSPDEIQENYNQEFIGDEYGLQGYWKLNGDLNDSSPNQNHLSSSTTLVLSSDIPF